MAEALLLVLTVGGGAICIRNRLLRLANTPARPEAAERRRPPGPPRKAPLNESSPRGRLAAGRFGSQRIQRCLCDYWM